jgi:hypothetical protein
VVKHTLSKDFHGAVSPADAVDADVLAKGPKHLRKEEVKPAKAAPKKEVKASEEAEVKAEVKADASE